MPKVVGCTAGVEGTGTLGLVFPLVAAMVLLRYDWAGWLRPGKHLMSAMDRLPDILAAMNSEGVEYVLFGGQAVNLYGILRFTDDIDLFVSPTPENVGRLRRALRRLWADPSIDEIRSEDLSGDYAVVRYGTPEGFYIDFVARLGEAFVFADVEATWVERGGVRVHIATPRMLYRMKKDTVRPLDRADAADLQAKFRLEDE